MEAAAPTAITAAAGPVAASSSEFGEAEAAVIPVEAMLAGVRL